MINFVTKFDNKSSNLGFFVPEEQLTLKSSKVDQNIKDKVNKLLKTIDKNKDGKKIHSFDIDDNQKLFLIIIKKNLINFQLNNLGGSFRNLVSSNKNLKKIIEEMIVHEKEHCEFFENEIKKRKIKPTKFLPLWDLLGVGLGFGSTILGKKTAMLCTASVEEVIDKHYQNQIKQCQTQLNRKKYIIY